jgi:hypothetical protein
MATDKPTTTTREEHFLAWLVIHWPKWPTLKTDARFSARYYDLRAAFYAGWDAKSADARDAV